LLPQKSQRSRRHGRSGRDWNHPKIRRAQAAHRISDETGDRRECDGDGEGECKCEGEGEGEGSEEGEDGHSIESAIYSEERVVIAITASSPETHFGSEVEKLMKRSEIDWS
jgi:hypothetical protein